jgi:hypothetical protein
MSGTLDTLRRWAWPVIGFVLGLGLGLFLAWQVFPVKWTDTDPSDLRTQHQLDYVTMTADSLAVTGNTDVARLRLADLKGDKGSWGQVAKLIESAAVGRERDRDNAGALRLRQLAQVASASAAASAETSKVSPTVAAPNQTALASPQTVGKPNVRISRLTIFLSAVGIFLVALAAVVWFLLKRSMGQSVSAGSGGGWSSLGEGQTGPGEHSQSGPIGSPAPLGSERRLSSDEPWTERVDLQTNLTDEEAEPDPEPALDQPQSGSSAPTLALTTRSSAPPPSSTREAPAVGLTSANRKTKALAPSGRTPQFGPFAVEYSLGDDDFDRAFSIEASDSEFLGECGVGIHDVLRAETVQHVDAFEVWLFDRNEGAPTTASKIVVSEYVYLDEAIRTQLSSKGEVVQAQSGLTFTLETPGLRVSATITDVDYVKDPQTPPNSAFAHLGLSLVAETTNP